MLRTTNDGDDFIAVSNFTPVPYIAYRLGVPKPGTYQVIFDSDSKDYWGSGYGTGMERIVASNISWQNQYHSIVIDLPPLATVFIKRVKDENGNKVEEKAVQIKPEVKVESMVETPSEVKPEVKTVAKIRTKVAATRKLLVPQERLLLVVLHVVVALHLRLSSN